jgi:hypothetical protein
MNRSQDQCQERLNDCYETSEKCSFVRGRWCLVLGTVDVVEKVLVFGGGFVQQRQGFCYECLMPLLCQTYRATHIKIGGETFPRVGSVAVNIRGNLYCLAGELTFLAMWSSASLDLASKAAARVLSTWMLACSTLQCQLKL